MKNRKFMEGYQGVKFKAIELPGEVPVETRRHYPLFRLVGEKLRDSNMAEANAGNISIRHKNGLIITSTGSHLGALQKDDLVYVALCRIETEEVYYFGPREPSSETLMHWLVYSDRSDVQAIIHAHDELTMASEFSPGEIEVSNREEPCGTADLARMAVETFGRSRNIIVLKNHGYVAVGEDLEKTCDRVVEAHYSLISLWPGRLSS